MDSTTTSTENKKYNATEMKAFCSGQQKRTEQRESIERMRQADDIGQLRGSYYYSYAFTMILTMFYKFYTLRRLRVQLIITDDSIVYIINNYLFVTYENISV